MSTYNLCFYGELGSTVVVVVLGFYSHSTYFRLSYLNGILFLSKPHGGSLPVLSAYHFAIN